MVISPVFSASSCEKLLLSYFPIIFPSSFVAIVTESAQGGSVQIVGGWSYERHGEDNQLGANGVPFELCHHFPLLWLEEEQQFVRSLVG